MRRKVGQVWNNEVFHRVEDGNKDQGFPHAQPCCEKREHDCLNEESNQAVDGHDNSHSLSSQAKATRNIEEARRGRVVMTPPFVLEEDGEKVVVRHRVIGEKPEGDDEHDNTAREDGLPGHAGDGGSPR